MVVLLRKTQRRIVAFLAFILAFSISAYTIRRALADVDWIDRYGSGQPWRGLASDSTGQYLAGVYNAFSKGIQISDNYGASWRSVGTDGIGNLSTHPWTSIASSGDGQTLVATETGGYIWISHDRGTTWENAHVNQINWTSASVTADGLHAAVIDATNHDVWLSDSIDLTSWVKDDPNGNSWTAVSYSPDGGTLVAMGGYFAVSNSFGDAWTFGGVNADWTAVAAFNGGGAVAVGGYTDVELISDYGSTWGDPNFGSAHDWSSVAISADGQTVVAGAFDDPPAVFVSTDGGSNWTDAPGVASDNFYTVTSNADGSFLAAAGYNDVWTLPAGPIVAATIFTTNDSLNNDGTAFATEAGPGFVIDLLFADQETPLIDPTVRIAGHATTTAQPAGDHLWYVEDTLTSDDVEGEVSFIISAGSADGTATTTITQASFTPPLFLDKTGPVITLIGQASITINVGDTYTDEGATANDARDGDVTDAIAADGTVDTSTAGTYTITYNATDLVGNAATPVVRTVIVSAPASTVTTRRGSSSSSGSSMSAQNLAAILAPGPVTTAYLNSLKNSQNLPAQIPVKIPKLVFTRDLEKGMSGKDVLALQQFLVSANAGPAAQKLTKNGFTQYFGALTESALIEFQKSKKITPAVGYFGPKTRAYIAEH